MRLSPLLVPFLLLSLAGCGGLGDQCADDNVECRDHSYTVTPTQAAIATHGTVDLTATALKPVDSIAFAVTGGDANGTLTYPTPGTIEGSVNQRFATYVAPDATGTYKVVVTFTEGSRVVSTQTVTIEAAVAP